MKQERLTQDAIGNTEKGLVGRVPLLSDRQREELALLAREVISEVELLNEANQGRSVMEKEADATTLLERIANDMAERTAAYRERKEAEELREQLKVCREEKEELQMKLEQEKANHQEEVEEANLKT